MPDHRVRTLAGASFAGFYDICYSKRTGDIAGFYYQSTSEWFQALHLKHVPTHTWQTYSFR